MTTRPPISAEDRARIKAQAPGPPVPQVVARQTPDMLRESLARRLYLISDPAQPWESISKVRQDRFRQFITDLTAYVQRIA